MRGRDRIARCAEPKPFLELRPTSATRRVAHARESSRPLGSLLKAVVPARTSTNIPSSHGRRRRRPLRRGRMEVARQFLWAVVSRRNTGKRPYTPPGGESIRRARNPGIPHHHVERPFRPNVRSEGGLIRRCGTFGRTDVRCRHRGLARLGLEAGSTRRLIRTDVVGKCYCVSTG